MSTKVSMLNLSNVSKEEDWSIIDPYANMVSQTEVNNKVKKKGLVRKVSKKLLSPRKNSNSKELE